MKDLISVIVPIYKVEEYLCRCVDSIINQTYKNLEIILVDDGSPDNCPRICDEYARKDSRIKVIHKENGGLSDARNAGMEIATGEYISFIDSDDWVDKNVFEKTIDVMTETNSNIGVFRYKKTSNNEETAVFDSSFTVLNSEQALGGTVKNVCVETVVWNKIYKRFVLENLRFRVGKCNEDEFFTFYALDKAQRIVCLNSTLYFYYQRSSSIMGRYSYKRLDMLDGVYEKMKFIEKKYPKLATQMKVSFCGCCIYHYQMLQKNKNIENYELGKEKVLGYNKLIRINFSDVKGLPIVERVSVLLSNSTIGMKMVCTLRNFMNYGV